MATQIKRTYYVVYYWQNRINGNNGLGAIDVMLIDPPNMLYASERINSMEVINGIASSIEEKYPDGGAVMVLNWKLLSIEEVDV